MLTFRWNRDPFLLNGLGTKNMLGKDTKIAYFIRINLALVFNRYFRFKQNTISAFLVLTSLHRIIPIAKALSGPA